MITVRLVSSKDNSSAVNMRDHNFDTRRQAKDFITRLGRLSRIDRFGRVYVVTPSKGG